MEFMEEKNKEELRFIDSMFAKEPHINVIDKDKLNERIHKVFTILYEALVKSFGPGGAGTFISNYPKYYNTKDGFTIMKNIAFDIKLDQVICDMMMDICSRLNFTVGDGTTTAVIATKTIYEAYTEAKEQFDKLRVLPRDVMSRLTVIRDDALKRIDKKSFSIRSDEPAVLAANIRNVVRISSNGNEEITNMISDLYRELMYPAISVVISKDGAMRSKIVTGYNIDVTLTDKLYVNNDNNSMIMNGANVLIFDHKVTKSTYENILKPLSIESANRGKHLLCIAPYYDEVALGGVIRTDLLKEYQQTKNVNLVLAVCKRVDGANKVRMDDLAMLLHTHLISTAEEAEMVEPLIADPASIYQVFNLDNRNIEGLPVAYPTAPNRLELIPYSKDNPNKPFGYDKDNKYFYVGYADHIEVGLKESTFSGFYYDQAEYDKYLNIAKAELAEIQKKVETIGTFSFDLAVKQERLYSLGLKTGIIEVGASSELSRDYLKDMVDDAVKAAASAYNNGVVLGCNVTLIGILMDMFKEYTDPLDQILINIIFNGFVRVYKSVMENVFPDTMFSIEKDFLIDMETKSINPLVITELRNVIRDRTPFKDINITDEEFEEVFKQTDFGSIQQLLIGISVAHQQVLDMSTGQLSSLVINSSETDKEILKATIDLLTLLITGNQMVLC